MGVKEAMVTTTRLMTYEDYAKMPDDERWELINGELILAPSPRTSHQDAQSNFGTEMSYFVRRRELGKFFFANTDVVLSDYVVLIPDLCFVSNERSHIITPANIQGAPDIVVEILSPSTSRRDWNDKRELYAAHGTREYFILDPSNKIVWRLTPKDGALEIEQTYYEGDTVTSTVLEGFSIAVDDIF